jgi:putative DNA primase/helicase
MNGGSNGWRGAGWQSDPLTSRAIRELNEERRKRESVLHRPAMGPTPRVTSGYAANNGAMKGNESPKPTVTLRNAAAIEPEAVRWLWPGWLALGKMHVIAGAPGAGKTTIAMSLAATVARGGQWPDGSRCPKPGRVVIWSGEDDPSDTLVPRLVAAGAVLSGVSFVDKVWDNGKNRSFDPATDIEPLREEIKRLGGADLLVIDPIVSAVAGDSHKNTEVRRALQPLADLAKDLGLALIGITHFSKATMGRNPVERLSGSLAFGAVARVVMVAARKETAPDLTCDERIFCRAKSNIGSDSGGFTYRLIQTALENKLAVMATAVAWGSWIDGVAREILAEAEGVEHENGGGKSEAVAFIQSILADGPKSVREIQSAAKANSIAWRTIERAKKDLGVKAVKSDFGGLGGWEWQLPQRPPKAANESEQESVAVFGGLCGANGRNVAANAPSSDERDS